MFGFRTKRRDGYVPPTRQEMQEEAAKVGLTNFDEDLVADLCNLDEGGQLKPLTEIEAEVKGEGSAEAGHSVGDSESQMRYHEGLSQFLQEVNLDRFPGRTPLERSMSMLKLFSSVTRGRKPNFSDSATAKLAAQRLNQQMKLADSLTAEERKLLYAGEDQEKRLDREMERNHSGRPPLASSHAQPKPRPQAGNRPANRPANGPRQQPRPPGATPQEHQRTSQKVPPASKQGGQAPPHCPHSPSQEGLEKSAPSAPTQEERQRQLPAQSNHGNPEQGQQPLPERQPTQPQEQPPPENPHSGKQNKPEEQRQDKEPEKEKQEQQRQGRRGSSGKQGSPQAGGQQQLDQAQQRRSGNGKGSGSSATASQEENQAPHSQEADKAEQQQSGKPGSGKGGSGTASGGTAGAQEEVSQEQELQDESLSRENLEEEILQEESLEEGSLEEQGADEEGLDGEDLGQETEEDESGQSEEGRHGDSQSHASGSGGGDQSGFMGWLSGLSRSRLKRVQVAEDLMPGMDKRFMLEASRVLDRCSQLDVSKEERKIVDNHGDQRRRRPIKSLEEISKLAPQDLHLRSRSHTLFLYNVISGKFMVTEKHRHVSRKQLIFMLVDGSGSMGGEKHWKASGFVMNRLKAVLLGDAELWLSVFDTEMAAVEHAKDEKEAIEMMRKYKEGSFTGGGTNIGMAVLSAHQMIKRIELEQDMIRPEIWVLTDDDSSIKTISPEQVEGTRVHGLAFSSTNPALSEFCRATGGTYFDNL